MLSVIALFALMLAEGILDNPVLTLGVLSGAGGVIAFLFRLLISSKDREFALVLAEKDRALTSVESVRKSYQEIATEALKSALDTANFYRGRDGQPPIIPPAAVVAESHSPSTAEQRETAMISTMRAQMAQIKLACEQTPRPEPEHAIEPVAVAILKL